MRTCPLDAWDRSRCGRPRPFTAEGARAGPAEREIRGDGVGAGRAALEHRQWDEQHPWPPRWLRWGPPALIVATLAIDQLTPPRYPLGPMLSASVVLSLFTYPPAGVLATG